MSDNSLNTARPLGVLGSRPAVRRDFVGLSDRLDFYKFSLNRSSNVRFQLSGLQANADLVMLNGTGRIIAQSRQGGNLAEQINRNLAAGTYYVQVVNRSRGTRYTLTGSATPPPNPGNGTLTNPFNLGTLTGGTVTRPAQITTTGSPKYYQFRLGQISDANIRLSQIVGNGKIDLYYDFNGNGRLDAASELVSFQFFDRFSNRPISKVLPATGAFFLKTERSIPSSSFQYDLLVTTTPAPGNLPTDPGTEEFTAYNLGTLNRGGQFEVKDYVGEIDGTDFYRFTLNEATTVTFNRAVTAGDINPQISIFQDRNNNGLLESNENLGSIIFPTTTERLSAGTYYISVKQFNLNNTAYSLRLSA